MDSALLFTILIIASTASQNTSAGKRAVEAYIKYAGIDKDLNQIQKNILSEETRLQVGRVIILTQSLIDKRVTFTWTFP